MPFCYVSVFVWQNILLHLQLLHRFFFKLSYTDGGYKREQIINSSKILSLIEYGEFSRTISIQCLETFFFILGEERVKKRRQVLSPYPLRAAIRQPSNGVAEYLECQKRNHRLYQTQYSGSASFQITLVSKIGDALLPHKGSFSKCRFWRMF